MNKIRKITFLCTGNACRSPMAEGIAKKVFTEKGLTDIEISSSGTHATDGFPPSIEAQIACYVNDIDISKHSAKVMTSEIAQNSDLILVMARHHIDWLAENFGSQIISKAYLLTEYGREENIKGEDIKDPITMPPEFYRHLFHIIKEEIVRVANYISNKESR